MWLPATAGELDPESNVVVQILVNGQIENVAEGTTVASLLDRLGVQRRHCAVEVNLALVPRDDHEERVLVPGDRMEVVTLTGGG